MAYTLIQLSGTYHDGPARRPFALSGGQRARFDYHRFFELTARIERSKRISTVVVDHRRDFSPGGFAAADSIRAAFQRLAAAGKHIIFCCEDCDTIGLYLAAACHARVLHPAGELKVLGFARRFLFFKKLVDRLRVRTTVIRRGTYKSAGDAFRTDSLDSANREQYGVFYEGVYRRIADAIARDLAKSEEDLAVLAEGHVLPAEQAVSHGWMTESATVEEITRRLEEQKAKKRSLKMRGRLRRRGRRIAVLFLDGALCDGESRRHPLLGTCVGDRSFGREIRSLADNKRTAGVVLRVSSPGGSALASETIRRELAHLHARKPVVVSMGNVAASGGYWVSTEADRIFAEPTTLTGSIGVLTLLFEVDGPLKRVGVTSDVIETGRFADLASPFRRLSREEHRILDARVEQIYTDFLERVATARNMTAYSVEEVAGGRVWSGQDAVDAGLVDELGGLPEAVSWMSRRLDAKRVSVRLYPEVKPSLLERVLSTRLQAGTAPAGRIHAETGHDGVTAPVLRALESLHRRPLAVVPELLASVDPARPFDFP
jgi:protease-4